MAEEMTKEERREKRVAKMKHAYEDFVGKIKADLNRLFAVCPPPIEPTYRARMHNECCNQALYFIPVLDFRGGIPRFEPAVHSWEKRDRPYGFGNGNSGIHTEIYERITRNPEPVDFLPTERSMGVLVSVYNLWDKSLSHTVRVPDTELRNGVVVQIERDEVRKGGWKVVYRFSQRSTPLPDGITTVEWWHAEHLAPTFKPQMIERTVKPKQAEPEPPKQDMPKPDRAGILRDIAWQHCVAHMYSGVNILDRARDHKTGIAERIERDQRILSQWHGGLPLEPAIDAAANRWDAEYRDR